MYLIKLKVARGQMAVKGFKYDCIQKSCWWRL